MCGVFIFGKKANTLEKTLSKGRNLRSAAAGFLTGLCNGLFGAGGGVVAVAALEKLCKLPAHKAHAAALGVVAPLCAVSGAVYLLNGRMDWTPMPFVTPALALGSFLGAKLLGRLNAVWINRVFSVVMFAAGLRMAL